MRVAAAGDSAPVFLVGIIYGQPDHPGPRSHEVASGEFVEFENALDHLFFGFLENTGAQALINQDTDFFLGNNGFLCFSNSHGGHEEIAREIEKVHQGRKKFCQAEHRAGQGRRDTLGIIQSDAFGNEFSDNDGEVSDGSYDDDEGQEVGVIFECGDFFEKLCQAVADSRAAQGAGEDSHKGDADLDGGKKFARGIGEGEGEAGSAIAFIGHALEARLSGGHHGDLRHGKEAVRQQKQQNENDL